jgi:hypothetical protein
MPSPVDGLPTGRPAGHQRHRVGKIDFASLENLSNSADAELRGTEDALISFMEQQQKRDRLYARSEDELKERFQFGRMGGVA